MRTATGQRALPLPARPLLHPPVMVPWVTQGILASSGRWKLAEAKAEAIARDAAKRGLLPSELSDALGVTQRPPKKAALRRKGNRRGGAVALPRPQDALVPAARRGDVLAPYYDPGAQLALAAQNQQPRLVRFDVLDMTLGAGHHSAAILEAGAPYTRVAALDCDYAMSAAGSALLEDFGPGRFRFIHGRMSQAQRLFGERSFDGVMIDPGPTVDQLADPARGFSFDDDEATFLDMRYSADFKTPLHAMLNALPLQELAGGLQYYGEVHARGATLFARAVEAARPVEHPSQLEQILATAFKEVRDVQPGAPVWQHDATRYLAKRNLWTRTMLALRCMVNDEARELRHGIWQGLELLHPEGHMTVVTRMPWEAALVDEAARMHPYAVLQYKEKLERDDIEALRCETCETTLWVLQRTAKAATVLKTAMHPPTPEEKQRGALLYMTGGADAVVTHGYPAANFERGYEATGRKAQYEEREYAAAEEAAVPDVDRSVEVKFRQLNKGFPERVSRDKE